MPAAGDHAEGCATSPVTATQVPLTFLTDGGGDVRDLPLYLNPQAEHLIDWFHVTMRLTVMGQMAKGLEGKAAAEVGAQLERLKWFLWHGNVFRGVSNTPR